MDSRRRPRAPVLEETALRLGLLNKAESVRAELRVGAVIVAGVSGVQTLSLRNADVSRDGRLGLVLRASGGTVRLRMSDHAARERWADAVRVEITKLNPLENLENLRVIRLLGEGGFGRVFLVRNVMTDERLAMKVVPKVDGKGSKLRSAVGERQILEQLDSEHVIRLKYAFQDERNLYMLFEHCEGGDLQHYLERREKRIGEEVVRGILAEVVLGLEYLHGEGIVYRDLKPQNVLLDARGHVRIADMGLAVRLHGGSAGRTRGLCGSKSYIAPEMFLKSDYGQKVDIWSLGVLMYTLLEGSAPFTAPSARTISDRRLCFSATTSPEAVETVYALLSYDERLRPSIEDVKKLPFFAAVDFAEVALTVAVPNERVFTAEESSDMLSDTSSDGPRISDEFSPAGRNATNFFDRLLRSRPSARDKENVVPGFSFVSDASDGLSRPSSALCKYSSL